MTGKSDHFDGNTFHNVEKTESRGIFSVLKWMFSRRIDPWPLSTDQNVRRLSKLRADSDELIITFINHSTCLIQFKGINILTDPIWSERASPIKFLGPKRVHLPGINFSDLPEIDFVLISHNHYDHMDIPTLKELKEKDNPTLLTGLGNKNFLESIGFDNVFEFDWWDTFEINEKMKIIFLPAKHFSARGLTDRNKTLWGGFGLLSGPSFVYFAGDTGYGNHFQEIRERVGQPLVSLLPIGAFKPRWFMKPVHMCPEEAVQAFLDLESKHAIAIHLGTFQLSDENIDEPEIILRESLSEKGLTKDSFMILSPGENKTYTLESTCEKN